MSPLEHSIELSTAAARTYCMIMCDLPFWEAAFADANASQDKEVKLLALKSQEKHLILLSLIAELENIAKDRSLIGKIPMLRNQPFNYLPVIRETSVRMLRFALKVRSLNERPIYSLKVEGLKLIIEKIATYD